MSITVKSLFNRDMIIQVKAVINKIALLDKNKSLNQAAKNLEEDDKTKHNYKTKPNYNLHGPGRYINLCKVIQVQGAGQIHEGNLVIQLRSRRLQ